MATDVDVRSRDGRHAGDWTADATALTFAQASSTSSSSSPSAAVEASTTHSPVRRRTVLACRDGLLRKRATATAVSAMIRMSSGVWKRRRLVLLVSSPAPHRPTTTGGGGAAGVPGRDDAVPMLLMYRNQSRDAALSQPTGIIRLDGGGAVAASGGGGGGMSPRLSFEGVEGHPRRLEVRLTLPSSDDSLLGLAFAGTDAPRRKKKKKRSHGGENVEEAPGMDVFSWGLKFPDAETATLWATTMRRLVAEPMTMMASTAADAVTSAVGDDDGDHMSALEVGGLDTRHENLSRPIEFTDAAAATTTANGRCDGRDKTNLEPPMVIPTELQSPPENENDGEAEEALVESVSTPASPVTAASTSTARDQPPPASNDEADDAPSRSISSLFRRLTNSWIRSSASSGGGGVSPLGDYSQRRPPPNRNGEDDDDGASSIASALPGLAPATPMRGRRADGDDHNDDDERVIRTDGVGDEVGVGMTVAHSPVPHPIEQDSVGGRRSDHVDGGGTRDDSGRSGRNFFTAIIATAIFFCASVGLLVESGVTTWWVDEMAAALTVLVVLLPWGWLALLLLGGPRRSVGAAADGGDTSAGNTGGLLAAFIRDFGDWIRRVIILSIILPPLAIITSAGVAAAVMLFLSGHRKLGMAGHDADPMAFLPGNDTLSDVVVSPATDGVHFAPFANDLIYEAMRNLTIAFKLAAMDAVLPAGLVDEETPEFRRTPWRMGLSLVGHALGPHGPFPPGSFVRTYLWMILPVSTVCAVSVSSIACRAFPQLGRLALLSSRRGYWIPAIVFGSVGILLGHDAWVNNWSRPVRYALYWRGYFRSMMAMGCLGACKSFVVHGALGRRSTVSSARRVSGGVSLCLTALSVPLPLRSLHERFRRIDGAPPPSCSHPLSLPWSDASGLYYGALAFTAFFAGLYFFGRARRRMTMLGIPVGELIHRFSMLPANTAYLILGVADDVLHFVLEVARRQVLRLVRGVLMPVAGASIRCLRGALCFVERFGREMLDVSIVVIRRAWDVIVTLWREAVVPALRVLATVSADVVRMVHRRFFVPTCRLVWGCIKRLINLVAKGWRCLCQATTWMCKAVRSIVIRMASLLGSFLSSATERVRLAVVWAVTYLVVPIVNFVREAVRVALEMAVEFAMRASSVAIDVMERLLSVIMHVLCRFSDAVASVLDWLWNRIARMAQSLFAKARVLSTAVCQMTTEVGRKYIGPALHHVLGALQSALETLWKWLSLACRFTLDRIIIPALRFGLRAGEALARASRDGLRAMSRIARYWFDYLVALSGRIHRRLRIIFSRYIYPPARVLWSLIVSFASAFLRKYWHLIPAGLVLNGSFLFAGAAIAGGGDGGLLFARLQYALGSWSLFLIGCTLLHAVISSRGNLVNQYVVVDQSILRHIDLHLGYVVSRVLVSGWHALSTVLKIVLNAIDIIIRKSFKALWRVLLHVHENALKPLFQISKAALWRVWNYPYLSIVASLTVLGSLYLYHTGKIAIKIPASCCSICSSSTFQFLVHTVPSKSLDASRTVRGQILAPLEHSVMKAYNHVYEPIVDIDVSSPSVALVCWVLTMLVTKARARMRLKLFAVPVVIVYVMGVTTIAVMRAYCVSYIVWIGLSVLVDRYEDRERRQAGVAFDTYQSGRRRQRQSQFPSHSSRQNVTQLIPVSGVGEQLAFQQTECCICLERFEDEGRGKESKLAELPCGHCFHEPCIHDWLLKCDNHRCPICRRATRGWDRVLEVVF